MKLPKEIFSQHSAVLGKTGSGKSSALRVCVEGLLDDHVPVCVIDPKGDWWGLKSSASGERAGYPVVIFGGDHADVPLNAHAGAHVAELVATGNRPCIIDLGGWMVGERTRFFIDFASTLFRTTRGKRVIIIDEVHNFAPQGKILDPDAGKMLHWANRLASEGRGKGLTIMSASQRPQKVHKDFLTCAETLIAMRVIHPLDRGAIKEWIDGCPDRDKGREVLDSLASMKRGEAWVWSPEIGYGPTRLTFPMFATFDSFKADANSWTHKLTGWAAVDLDEVKTKLATVVEEAKANDPKELRKTIADLRQKVAALEKAKPTPAAKAPKIVERMIVTDAQIKRLEALQAKVHESIQKCHVVAGNLERAIFVGKNKDDISTALNAAAAPTPTRAPIQRVALASGREARVNRRGAEPTNGELTRPQEKVLTALAWWQDFSVYTPSREQVAFVASMRPTSGHYKNILGGMRTAGLVTYPQPNNVQITQEGLKLVDHEPQTPSFAELCDRINSILDRPQRDIFQVLVDSDGSTFSREKLAEAARFKETSGHFKNMLGSLRTLGIIEYPQPNYVQLSELIEGFRGQ